MHVLITLSRFMLGGTETYTVTVAEQLERLGHSVTIHAGEASDHGRDLAASRGVRLKVGDLAAQNGFDAVLAQDTESSYLLAGRRPGLDRSSPPMASRPPSSRPASSIRRRPSSC